MVLETRKGENNLKHGENNSKSVEEIRKQILGETGLKLNTTNIVKELRAQILLGRQPSTAKNSTKGLGSSGYLNDFDVTVKTLEDGRTAITSQRKREPETSTT